jgi:hypothetical protein
MTNDLNTSADQGAENVSKVDTGSVGKSFSEVLYDDVAKNGVLGLFNSLKDVTANIKGEIDSLLSFGENWKRLKFLDTESADIIKSLGLGSQKAGEFRKMIADGAASFAGIGLSVEKVGETYLEIASAFNSNISVGVDDLTELAATAKVTGIAGKDLAAAFRGVGVDIEGIGPRMFEVTKIARESGVAVSAVAKGVTTNLDKMNIYNFEGGVKGLAKMSAQAAKLGIDMQKIFTLTDKVFNPEGAIEVAAAMQRLGVSTGALVDPLRLMDLSQNDPTELQNQIVNMTKDFVRFNKDLGEFQILPGEKRRLEEIAKALGLSGGELQKMALNASNLEYKMKQIKFPSSIASKEDRELIGTLSQMNKDKFTGEMVAQIKVKQFDEKGEYTGKDKMINVSELTKDQLEQIKEDQKLRGKTMEDVAFDQLGELEKLNAKFDQFKKAAAYGLSSNDLSQKTYGLLTTGARETLFKDEKNPKGMIPESVLKTENWRDMTNQMTSSISSGFEEAYKKLSSINSMADIPGVLTEIGNMAMTALGGLTFDKIMSEFEKTNPGASAAMGTSGANTTNVNAINSNTTNSSLNNTNNTNVNNVTPPQPQELNLNEKVTVDVNVNLDPASKDQALTSLMNQALTKFFGPEGGNQNIAFVLNEIEKQKTQNGLVQSNVPGVTKIK